MSRRKNRIGIFDRIIAISVAVLVFIAFAFFLWTNIQENNKQEEDREVVQAFDAKEIATIAASTVTEDQIKKQKDKILNKEKEKARKEKERQEREKKKLADLKKKQQQEKKKLDDIKKKQAEEQKAIALKKKKAEEDEKKRKLAEKKRKEKELAEKKKREADKRKRETDEKKRIAEEKKREAEEQKKLAEAAAKQERQDALQAEIEAERQQNQQNQQALAEQSARNSATLLTRYAALMRDKIQPNFVVPTGSRIIRVPVVNIKLDDSGNVLNSRIVIGSGDFSYDQAVLAAIAKSSPLPLPDENLDVKRQLQDFELGADFQL